MFNKIWDQSSDSKEKQWSTEKELILYMIDKSYGFRACSHHSGIYDKYAPEEWKNNSQYFDTKHSKGISFRSWDCAKLEYLADHCDDADILHALFESDKVEDESFLMRYFIDNVNLPDDIIIKLCEKHRSCSYTLEKMQMVEYKYITEETKAKIDAAYVEHQAEIRKEKEEKTKQKLTAFLTTAAATKSVLTGNSIDDVVEQTITSDVDDAVLDYMNKLFDK
jgi:hypothetical protein